MLPELTRIGPITVYSYGTMIALAVLVALFLVWRQAPREGVDPNVTVDLMLAVVLAGLVGSRLVYVLLNWRDYAATPWSIIGVGGWERQGLTIHGGLLGGVAAGWIMARRLRLRFWMLADLYARALAIALGIGRIGCLLAGCCFGRLTGGDWGCTTVYAPGLRHPSQLYETFLLTLLFIYLSWRMGKPRRLGQLFGLFVAGYGIARFLAEFFREGERVAAGLTLGQLVSLGLLLLGAAIWYLRRNSMPVGEPGGPVEPKVERPGPG